MSPAACPNCLAEPMEGADRDALALADGGRQELGQRPVEAGEEHLEALAARRRAFSAAMSVLPDPATPRITARRCACERVEDRELALGQGDDLGFGGRHARGQRRLDLEVAASSSCERLHADVARRAAVGGGIARRAPPVEDLADPLARSARSSWSMTISRGPSGVIAPLVRRVREGDRPSEAHSCDGQAGCFSQTRVSRCISRVTCANGFLIVWRLPLRSTDSHWPPMRCDAPALDLDHHHAEVGMGHDDVGLAIGGLVARPLLEPRDVAIDRPGGSSACVERRCQPILAPSAHCSADGSITCRCHGRSRFGTLVCSRSQTGRSTIRGCRRRHERPKARRDVLERRDPAARGSYREGRGGE